MSGRHVGSVPWPPPKHWFFPISSMRHSRLPFLLPPLIYSPLFFFLNWCLPLSSARVDSHLHTWHGGSLLWWHLPVAHRVSPESPDNPWLCPMVAAVGGSPANVYAESDLQVRVSLQPIPAFLTQVISWQKAINSTANTFPINTRWKTWPGGGSW